LKEKALSCAGLRDLRLRFRRRGLEIMWRLRLVA